MSGHHVSSLKTLLANAAALMFLTALTVAVPTFFSIPSPYNIIVAIAIAVVKATLVALFFMNLYWDVKFNAMLLITGVIFVGLLVGITMLDTMFREAIIPAF
jgi:cytochrome c oxidase subunit 4